MAVRGGGRPLKVLWHFLHCHSPLLFISFSSSNGRSMSLAAGTAGRMIIGCEQGRPSNPVSFSSAQDGSLDKTLVQGGPTLNNEYCPMRDI